MKLTDKLPVFTSLVGLDTRRIHKVSEEALEDSKPRRFVTDFWLTDHEGHCELWIWTKDMTGVIVYFDERGRQIGTTCGLYAEAAQGIRVDLQTHRHSLAQGRVSATRGKLHDVLHSIGLNPASAHTVDVLALQATDITPASIQSDAP